jgi:Ca2+-transporting ATPase
MVASVAWVFSWANASFGLDVARTMAITTAIFFELFFVFSCKTNRSIFTTGIFNNKYLIYSVLISGGLHLLAIYTLLGGVFGFVSLTGFQLGISVLFSLSGIIVFESWKIGKYLFGSRR